MAANPEVEGIITFPAQPLGALAEIEEAPVAPKVEVRRSKPPWRATAALGAVALVAAGALGYTANAAAQQRNQAYDAFVTTKAALVSTQGQLTAAQADAATKKVTADYLAMYTRDSGQVETDYSVLGACGSFAACRTGSQQLLTDLQKFQSDRKAAIVPGSLSASDASLGDALSAAIAADTEIIDGMDSDSVNKFKDGFRKLDAAMLNVAKAQAALGNELK